MHSEAGERSVGGQPEPGRVSRRAMFGLVLAGLILLSLPFVSLLFVNGETEKHCEQVSGPSGATEVCHPIKNLPDDGRP